VATSKEDRMNTKAVFSALVVCLMPMFAPGYEWVRRYSSTYGDDAANGIALSSVGAPYVTGYTTDSLGTQTMLTIKYSANNGDSVVQTWGVLTGDDAFHAGNAIAVSPAGNVYVTGYSTAKIRYDGDDYFYRGVAVLRYDSALTNRQYAMVIWPSNQSAKLEEPEEPEGRAIALRGDSAFVAAKAYQDTGRQHDFYAAEFLPSGSARWQNWVDSTRADDDECNAVAVDNSGNTYCAGALAVNPGAMTDYALYKFRPPSGLRAWASFYNGPANGNDVAAGVVVDAGGSIYVTGSSESTGTCTDFATVKYDTSGMLRWVARYNGPTDGPDEARAIAVGLDGGIYVAGTSDSAGQSDHVTVKYDTSGNEVWRTRIGGAGEQVVSAMVVGADGCIYVTGSSALPGYPSDYYTIKLSPEGESLGTWTYDNGGSDVATAVALDINLNLYVTGQSADLTGSGVATVKYRQLFQGDVGLTAILSPPVEAVMGDMFKPVVSVINNDTSSAPDAFNAIFTIDSANYPVYCDTCPISLQPGGTVVATFDTWTVTQPPGFYVAKCTLEIDDSYGNNNVMRESVCVYPSGWHEMAPVLQPPSGKAVKEGGWLAYDPDGRLVYGGKGYKTRDFYSYDPQFNKWVERDLIPLGTEGKPAAKGAAGCCDDSGRIWMTKGGNTQGFHCYDIAEGRWDAHFGDSQPASVPLGPTNKKVKGGTGIAWAYKGGVGSPYLLKGYKNEFYRYDIPTDSWIALPDAPPGANPKYDKGSWLVSDGAHTLYAHKAKYHEFYKYNTETDSWIAALTSVPIPGSAGSKKSKDGGCGTFLDGYVYALKGGNTQELWRYKAIADSWKELDTVPRMGSTGKKKKVKAGGSIVAAGRKLFAFKGNKCLEFWRYVPSGLTTEFGACASYSGGRGGSGGFSGESGLSYGIEATSPPRWSADGSAVCYCREAEDGNGAGFEQVFVVYANQPNVELRAADIAMDCFDPVFDPSSENLCFVVDDTATDRLQLATVPVPELDARGIKPQASSFRLRNGRGPSSSTSASWSRELETRDQKLVQARSVASGAWSLSKGKATPAGSFGATLITSSKWDHYGPASFSPTGDLIYYSRDDSANRTQAYVISAQGGTETALTDFSDADVEDVSFLDDEHVVFIYSEDGEYDRVAKLDVNTHELDILSDGDYDAETPDASYDGNWVTFSALGDNGAYQVGMVNADGSGEDLITSSSKDLEAPDWSGDGVSIAVSREATTIGMVDAGSGDFTPLTDSGETVLRELPDAYWNELGAQNLVVYTRENLSGSDGSRPRPPRRLGTGIFLVKHRKPHDGPMGAGLATLLRRGSSNPARGRVSVFWQVAAPGTKATVRVYDAAGRQVKELFSGKAPAGLTEAVWTCSDQKGRKVATGIYFCTLENGEKRISRKVVLAE